MPNPQKLYILTKLREERGLTLEQMARCCGFVGKKSRESVGKWEQGLSVPETRRRTEFINYLYNGLGLWNDKKTLDSVWEILEKEWGWEPPTSEELLAYLPDTSVQPEEGILDSASIRELFSPAVRLIKLADIAPVSSEEIQSYYEGTTLLTWNIIAAEAAYRQQIIETYKDLSFSGLGNLSLGDIPAEQIFVHLTLIGEKAESSKATDQPREEKSYQSTRVDSDSVPIKLTQALSKNVVIVGEPGAGKSTLLRWLAVSYAQKRQPKLNQLDFEANENRLPIFVKLGLLSDYYIKPDSRVTPNWMEALPEYVSRQQNFSDLPPLLLKQALKQGRCLLLLDGLDEIVDQTIRTRLVSSLAEMAHRPSGNRLVISSRSAALEVVEGILFPQFQRCQIARFAPPQLQKFFRFWYTIDPHLPPEECRRKADELYARVQDSPKLLELATTPLIATILVLLWRKEEALPDSLAQLYERCCYTLIELWEKAHDVIHDAIFTKFGWKDHLAMLARLAFAIHKQETRASASEEYLANELADFFLKKLVFTDQPSAKIEAEKSLRILGVRSGLFQYLGDDQYGFLHLSFQAYLAARYIAEQLEPDYINLVMEHMHKGWWHEVHVLVIAHLSSDAENQRKASNLMLTILNHYRPLSLWLSMLDLASPDVLAHKPPLSSLLTFLLRHESGWIAFLLIQSLSLLVLPWIVFTDIIPYLCPLEWRIAHLLEREYTLVVDGYRAAGFPPVQQLSDILSKHAQSLLWRSIYDIDKVRLSEETLRSVYSTLREHFGKHKQEREELIQKLMEVIEHSPHLQVQSAAIESLGEIGQGSKRAIDILIRQVNDQADEKEIDPDLDQQWPLSEAAVDSLGKLGISNEVVVNTLIHALNHKSWRIREAATKSLGRLEQTNNQIIEALINLLQKGESEYADTYEYLNIYKAGIESLGRLNLIEPRIIQPLVKALHHTSDRIRQAAINELTRLSQSNVEVVDALIGAVRQEWDWLLHSAVIDCLVNAGQAEPEVVKRLLPYLSHASSGVKLVVTGTLIKLGNIDSSIETVLCKLLTDDDPAFRYIAVEQVSKIGQVSEQTTEILTRLLHSDRESSVKVQAALALGGLHITSNEVITALIDALDDVTVHWHGMLSLRKFRQRNWQIDIEQIQKVSLNTVDDNQIDYYSYDVAIAAAFSLGLLGKADDLVIQALSAALHNVDQRVREEAAISLGALGVATDLVVSALTEALNDAYLDYRSGEYPVAMAAAISLVKLGKTKEVEPQFSDFHQTHRDELHRYRDVQLAEALHLDAGKDASYFGANEGAIKNLLNTGVSKEELANCFIDALKHKNKNVRIAAASGLGQLGYLDDNVVSVLMRMIGAAPLFPKGKTLNLLTTPASAGIASLGRLPIEDLYQLKHVIKFLENHRRNNRDITLCGSAFYGIRRLLRGRPFPDYHWTSLPKRRAKYKRAQFIGNCLFVVAVISFSIYGLAWFNAIKATFFVIDSSLKFTVLTVLIAIAAQFRSYILRDPWEK